MGLGPSGGDDMPPFMRAMQLRRQAWLPEIQVTPQEPRCCGHCCSHDPYSARYRGTLQVMAYGNDADEIERDAWEKARLVFGPGARMEIRHSWQANKIVNRSPRSGTGKALCASVVIGEVNPGLRWPHEGYGRVLDDGAGTGPEET